MFITVSIGSTIGSNNYLNIMLRGFQSPYLWCNYRRGHGGQDRKILYNLKNKTNELKLYVHMYI